VWRSYIHRKRARVCRRAEVLAREAASIRIQSVTRGKIGRRKHAEFAARMALEKRSAIVLYRCFRKLVAKRRAREFRGVQSVLRYSPRFPEAMKQLELQIAPLTLHDLAHMDPEDISQEDMRLIMKTARDMERQVSASTLLMISYC
jgi:hypothetical protein